MHWIIIPHRKRTEYLEWTLWSLRRTMLAHREEDYVVLVVDDGTLEHELEGVRWLRCDDGLNVELLRVDPRGPFFCKPYLQNAGITHSERADPAPDDVLTFLDADMLVGRHWSQGIRALAHRAPTRLCYRVRMLSRDVGLKALQNSAQAERLVDGWFHQYAQFERATEVYFTVELSSDNLHGSGQEPVCYGPHVFGNSQWSIRREVLGDLRYNEAFVGCGYEDLWMIREIDRRHPEYVGLILTEPSYALLHIGHPDHLIAGDPWFDPELNQANERRFKAT